MRTLAGRYTLEDRVLDGAGWSYWRGEDAVLHRAVGVLVLAADDPREAALVEAAQQSAALEDPHVQRVLDVLDDTAETCLVMEFLTGSTSLEELLAEGPLTDADTRLLVLELARALATVARAGLEHGALAPRWVIRTDTGRVRLLGVAVAPVLVGHRTTDATGLGELLYACLTARWPGRPDDSGLSAAPGQGGRPVRPRMIRAGVPADLDDIAARALGLAGRGSPLRTAADVVAALETAATENYRRRASDPADPADPAEPFPLEPARRGRGRRVAAVSVVLTLVLAAALMTGLSLVGPSARSGPGAASSGGPGASTGSSSSPAGPAPGQAPLPILSVHDFDPKPRGNGSENPALVGLAVDNDPTTAWTTLTYTRPDCGGLKPGVGLILDLGLTTEVGAVRLNLVGRGTSVEVRAATSLPSEADDAIAVAQADAAGEFVTLPLDPPIRARYLLIWLTRLPADGNGYRGGISDIQVFHS